MPHASPTLHVSAIAPVAPSSAALAYDQFVESEVGTGARRWSFRYADWSLDAVQVAVSDPPAGHAYWPMRRALGELRGTTSRCQVPVEIELLPWSAVASEVGLRPRDERQARRLIARHPLDPGRQRYVLLAHAVATTLAYQLMEGDLRRTHRGTVLRGVSTRAESDR